MGRDSARHRASFISALSTSLGGNRQFWTIRSSVCLASWKAQLCLWGAGCGDAPAQSFRKISVYATT